MVSESFPDVNSKPSFLMLKKWKGRMIVVNHNRIVDPSAAVISAR